MFLHRVIYSLLLITCTVTFILCRDLIDLVISSYRHMFRFPPVSSELPHRISSSCILYPQNIGLTLLDRRHNKEWREYFLQLEFPFLCTGTAARGNVETDERRETRIILLRCFLFLLYYMHCFITPYCFYKCNANRRLYQHLEQLR